MWASAQRDGCPAEYRWRLLVNAAKFGWRPLLECRAVTLPIRKTRWNLQGCPQTAGRISTASGPKFTILWERVYEILLRNNLLSDCRYVPHLRRYSPTKLCDSAQIAIFDDFLHPVFAASAVQHVSHLHLKFALSHTMCASMGDIQFATAEIMGGEKEEDR